MEKQKLAQKRNYFKYVLHGIFKPIDLECLTEWELEEWATILDIKDDILSKFDNNSRVMGLNVPEFKCWCGKEGKYPPSQEYPEMIRRNMKFCKKHKPED